jgi:hypothetical protein
MAIGLKMMHGESWEERKTSNQPKTTQKVSIHSVKECRDIVAFRSATSGGYSAS